MNNKLLNAIFLSTLLKEENQDRVDMLTPFVMMSIDYEPEQRLYIQDIAENMEKEFHFTKLPSAVIEKVLKRIVKKKTILYKKNNHYWLNETFVYKGETCQVKKKLEDDKDEFWKKYNEKKKETDQLINTLAQELSLDGLSDREKLHEYLDGFLESFGFTVLSNPKKLGELQIDDDINYKISNFVRKHYLEDTYIYELLIKTFEGYMIKNVIYSNGEKETLGGSFKDVTCYLDTSILLRVLELKTDEENSAAKIMVRYLKENKAKVACFDHNIKEVVGILNNYKYNIGKIQYQTLENLKQKNVDSAYVNQLIGSLEENLNDLGVKIEETPIYTNKNVVYSENDLRKHLSKKINYSTEEQIDNDIKSATAIKRFRTELPPFKLKKIETCKAIFVSMNNALVNSVNSFFNSKDFVPPLYSNIDLTTILWMKNPQDYDDLPKRTLLQYAYASLNPSPMFIRKFKEKIDNLKIKDNLEGEVIERVIHDSYTPKEIMELTNGDINNLDEAIIKNELDSYRNYRSGEKSKLLHDNEHYKRIIDQFKNDKKNVLKEKEVAEKTNFDVRDQLISEKDKRIHIKSRNVALFFVGITMCILIISVLLISYIITESFINFGIAIPFITLGLTELFSLFSKNILYRHLYLKWKTSLERRYNNKKIAQLIEKFPKLFDEY